MVVVLIVLPWALGGLHPTREDLTWAILLAFAAGFLSIAATVCPRSTSPGSTSATPTEATDRS